MLIIPPSCLRPRRANQTKTPTRSNSGHNEKSRLVTEYELELVPVTWTPCVRRRGERALSFSGGGVRGGEGGERGVSVWGGGGWGGGGAAFNNLPSPHPGRVDRRCRDLIGRH